MGQLKNLSELMLKKNKKFGEVTKVHRRNEIIALLARCGQVHLVFHSDLSELGQINYRPIMVKQLNCKLIP
jgi:hypothetical protein